MAPFSFSSGEKNGSPRRSSNKSPRNRATRPSSSNPERKGKNGGNATRTALGNERRGSSGKKDGRENPVKNGSRDKDRRAPLLKERQERRYRNFAVPVLPADITGDELEKRRRAELRPLAEENAVEVAKHLVAILRFLESDPNLAYRHAQEATFRAGRVALVREFSGMAALRSGHFEVAQKDLRAAARISGSKELLPFIAQCEVALGHPRKALSIAGEIDANSLSVSGQVELRIAAASARIALGQPEAAAVTLRCKELNRADESWSRRLHQAYREALLASGNDSEAEALAAKFPQSFAI